MPSLTVQYMSDSGTVELSRDCGEEGTRHMSCRGKEDRDTILNDLTCIDEVDASDNTLKATTEGSAPLIDVHQKSVDLISKIVTDNMEDNRIDSSSNKVDEPPSPIDIKEKLNLDDLMMGDQAILTENAPSTVYPLNTKPTKKPAKKFDDKYFKKSTNNKKLTNKKIDSNEELMLGDQPIKDTLMKTNSGEEILPHSKKSLPEDLKHKESLALTSTPMDIISTTQSSSSIVSSSTETRLRRETEMSTNSDVQTTTESFVVTQSTTGGSHIESTSEEPISMPTNHPEKTVNMQIPKITKKSFNSYPSRHRDIDFNTTPHHIREKPDADLTNDHFIPPMLLVRTKFTPTKPHADETTIVGDHHQTMDHHDGVEVHSESVSIPAVTESNLNYDTTTTIILDTTTENVVTNDPLVGTTTATVLSTDVSSSEAPITTEATTHIDKLSSTTTTTSLPVTILPATTKLVTIIDPVVESITNGPSFRQPHAPWHTSTHSTTSASPIVTSTLASTTTTTAPVYNTTPLTTDDRIIEIKTDTTTETILVTTKVATSPTNIVTEFGNATTTVAAQSTELNHPTIVESSSKSPTSSTPTTTTTTAQAPTTGKLEISDENASSSSSSSSTIAALSAIEDISSTEDHANHSDFTNAENYHPYRPNRRRSLTKPEVHTYIKKILG